MRQLSWAVYLNMVCYACRTHPSSGQAANSPLNGHPNPPGLPLRENVRFIAAEKGWLLVPFIHP